MNTIAYISQLIWLRKDIFISFLHFRSLNETSVGESGFPWAASAQEGVEGPSLGLWSCQSEGISLWLAQQATPRGGTDHKLFFFLPCNSSNTTGHPDLGVQGAPGQGESWALPAPNPSFSTQSIHTRPSLCLLGLLQRGLKDSKLSACLGDGFTLLHLKLVSSFDSQEM